MNQGTGEGSTFWADAELYLQAGECLKVDRGRSVEALEATMIHVVVMEEHWEGIRGLNLGCQDQYRL